jgi:hypothetical protein
MKSKGLLYLVFAAGMFPLFSWVLSPGGSPGGKTGSPGDGGTTCTQCHSGSAQQATGWITSNIPATGYVPGQTYTITATATHNGAQLFGFEVTAEDDLNAKKGTWAITNATQTKLVNGGKAVTHTANGTSPSGNSKTWSFNWTAPATGSGQMTFWGAFNAANGNGGTSGDVIYVSSLAVNEISTSITENPADRIGMKAFPNPFGAHLDVSLAQREEVKEVRLVSINGSTVYKSGLNDGGSLRIETSDIPAGTYQLVMTLADGTNASRMVIKN